MEAALLQDTVPSTQNDCCTAWGHTCTAAPLLSISKLHMHCCIVLHGLDCIVPPVLQGRLGELTAGAAADLVLVDGDPLDDIAVLANSSNIKMVIKHGLLAKVRRSCGAAWSRVCTAPGHDSR